MQMTHWKAASLTRSSFSGFLGSSSTSFVSVKSIVGRSDVVSRSTREWGRGLDPNSSSTSMSFLGVGVGFCLDGGLVDSAGATVVDVRRRLLVCTEPVRAAAAVVVRRRAGGIASEKELAGLSNESCSSKESKVRSVDCDSPAVFVEEES